MDSIKIWLIHPNQKMCQAFQTRFAGLPEVRVLQTCFEDLEPHDCFVTAANSFGIMTAGIDAAVVRYFGEELMQKVQFRIMNNYLGEQPVGSAFLVETNHPSIPYVCHAPTMRVPGGIDGTDKVYMATWGALLAIYQHNQNNQRQIETVAFPAFGAGFGGVPYAEVARQMAAAYDHFLNPPHRLDWDWVARRQKSICYDGNRQVVRG
ncbi:phage tail protein [Bremerella cremea]|uniref:Phage tail protein n=1 Tax=Bremerella cremea TaxID=1031537 RepID=A0A368KQX1_9BACT|nr:phage tail protein [Bremerella cremea]